MKQRVEYYTHPCNEVLIIASGPSFGEEQHRAAKKWKEQDTSRLVVVINRTNETVQWADILYTIDGKFARVWEDKHRAFNGIGVIHECASYKPEGWKIVKQTQTGNSGSAAIEVVSRWGAKTIWLMGFDATFSEDGKRHHHEDYPAKPEGEHPKNWCMNCPNIHEFKNYFNRAIRMANGMGAEVYNLSPLSNLKADKKTLQDFLNE